MGRGRALLAVMAVAAGAGPADAAHARAPRSGFDLANRCFAAAAGPSGRFVVTDAAGYRATAASARDATALYFKPTGLGTYMLQDAGGRLVSVGNSSAVVRGAAPGPAAEWAARRTRSGRFGLRSTANGGWLTALAGTGALATATAADPAPDQRWRLTVQRGCLPYPEAALGASGRPQRSVNRDGTVFGYADAHLHITADLRAGGDVIYGENFDRFGITEALGHDADVHGRDGALDVTGNLLRSGNPVGTHDTHGWPTFAGWPTFDTYTHQQVNYRWLQRDWKAGLRLVTAQLVEDQPLCMIEPIRSHSCDETATIALEVARLRGLQDYVDAQSGGPGRGWMRIVESPTQARRVIEQGKLAVLMGVESSNPFGCSEFLDQPQCTRADVDRGITLYRRLGISGLFIAHWVDNAFAGAALEGGDKGTFIGAMQVEQTGLPFSTAPCPEAGQGSQCNSKGLTDLGAYLVRRMMDNHMLIELDHLSERARLTVLAMAEARHYPVVSSHTDTGGIWTPSDLRRLYALGGFATARPDTAAKLAERIVQLGAYAPPGQFVGVGLGTDTGGFSALPGPDPEAAKHPLHYPFRAYGSSISFLCESTGSRQFNLNKDGVAHYGLFADLLAYMRQQKDGGAASALLYRSAEAYLRMWQRVVAA